MSNGHDNGPSSENTQDFDQILSENKRLKLQNDQYLKIASDKEKRINKLNAILDKQSKALKLTKVFKSAARQIKYKF